MGYNPVHTPEVEGRWIVSDEECVDGLTDAKKLNAEEIQGVPHLVQKIPELKPYTRELIKERLLRN